MGFTFKSFKGLLTFIIIIIIIIIIIFMIIIYYSGLMKVVYKATFGYFGGDFCALR
tara:strand:+ start:576 stop:743 length:168 start_codon:yes stop_codon:yes gene_type:complete